MADRWDNIDILRGIDRYQQETYHGVSVPFTLSPPLTWCLPLERG